MPRVSPDGRFLVFTASSYGNFFIWHRDADLFIYDLQANTYRPLTEANSPFAESYHSWSDNSRWLVFSSRRKDGLYTHPHFAYIAPDGSARKAFVLPQQSPDFYDVFDRSFNIPEFVTSEITVGKHALSKAARQTTGVKINFSDGNSYPDNVSSENIAH